MKTHDIQIFPHISLLHVIYIYVKSISPKSTFQDGISKVNNTSSEYKRLIDLKDAYLHCYRKINHLRTAHQINIPTRGCEGSEFMMVYKECNVM